ncbi:InlB B-repeat-containing protein, partial [Staphylococcus aureus]
MSNLAIVAGTAKTLTANAFTRTGYTFQGWTTNADGTGTTYTNSQSVTLYSNVTLYAKWLAGTFAVTFGSNTATGSKLTTN